MVPCESGGVAEEENTTYAANLAHCNFLATYDEKNSDCDRANVLDRVSHKLLRLIETAVVYPEEEEVHVEMACVGERIARAMDIMVLSLFHNTVNLETAREAKVKMKNDQEKMSMYLPLALFRREGVSYDHETQVHHQAADHWLQVRVLSVVVFHLLGYGQHTQLLYVTYMSLHEGPDKRLLDTC